MKKIFEQRYVRIIAMSIVVVSFIVAGYFQFKEAHIVKSVVSIIIAGATFSMANILIYLEVLFFVYTRKGRVKKIRVQTMWIHVLKVFVYVAIIVPNVLNIVEDGEILLGVTLFFLFFLSDTTYHDAMYFAEYTYVLGWKEISYKNIGKMKIMLPIGRSIPVHIETKTGETIQIYMLAEKYIGNLADAMREQNIEVEIVQENK